MELGRQLARAVSGLVGLVLSAAAGAVVVMAVMSPTITLAAARPWLVTVGDASRTLYPGVDATMPYEIRNEGSEPQVLHGTSVEFRNDGVGVWDRKTHRYVDECQVAWFRTSGGNTPTDVEIAPKASITGTVGIAFDQAAASEDACQNIAIDVTVTAT
jgi:hypothetical protein